MTLHDDPAHDDAPPMTEQASRPSLFRRILRFLKRAALVILVLLLVVRVTMGLWLPPVARSAARSAGVHVEWSDLDLTLLGLGADLTGLRVVALRGDNGEERTAEELAAARPLARLDDLGFDVDASALLTGTLRVHRVEAGGLDLWLSRDVEGVWNVETLVPPSEDDGEPEEPDSVDDGGDAPDDKGAAEPRPMDFSSPVEIGSVSLAGIRLHLDDQFVQPTLETTLEADLFLRDVGHDVRPAELGVALRASGLLDVATVDGEVNARGGSLAADLRVHVAGIDLDTLEPYLAPMGIVPVAHRLGTGLRLTADLGAADGEPVSGTLQLAGLEVRANGEAQLAAPDVSVTISALEVGAVVIDEVALTGGFARAERLADGTLRVVGLDLVGAPADPEEPDDEPAEEEAEDADDTGTGNVLRIDLVRLEDFRLSFLDGAVEPTASIEGVLGARIESVDVGPAPRPLAAEIRATLANIGDLTVVAALSRPAADAPDDPIQVEGSVRAENLTLAAVEPYLAGAGLRPTFVGGESATGGTLTLDLGATLAPLPEGGQRIDANLRDLAWSDGAGEALGGLGRIDLVGATVGTEDGATTVESLGLTGLQLPVQVLPSGAFRGLGVATLGIDDGNFVDAAQAMGIGGADVELTNVAAGPEGTSARLVATLELIGVATEARLRVDANAPSDPAEWTTLTGTLDLDGLRYDGAADILRAAGIEPVMEQGALRLAFVARTAASPDGVSTAEVTVTDLAAESDGENWLTMDTAQVYITMGEGETTVESLAVDGPVIQAERTAEGHIRVAGLLIGAATPPETVDVDNGAEDGAQDGAQDRADDQVAESEAAPDSQGAEGNAGASDDSPEDPPADVLRLVEAALENVTLKWTDRSVEPVVETAITLALAATDVTLEGGLPASFEAQLGARVEGVLDVLTVRAKGGGFAAGDGEVTLDLIGTGLRAGPLAAYLPPTVEPLLEDGRVTVNIRAGTSRLEQGGHAMEASIEDLTLRDGADGEPLLALGSMTFSAPRIDPGAGVFEIGAVTGTGVELEVRKTGEGRHEALGFAIIPAPPGEGPGTPPVTELTGDDVPGAPAPQDPSAPGARTDPPSVTLERLDLGIGRLRYVDATPGGGSVPVELELTLRTRGPEVLLAPDPEDVGSIELELRGAVRPLVGEVLAELVLEPFAPRPRAMARLGLTGIDGSRLAEVAPELAQSLDLGLYRNGSVTLALDAALDVNRRGPLDLGMGRSFGAQALVGPLEIRPDPEAEPTGFTRLDVEMSRFDPETGDIKFANIDLEGIRARVTKDARGTVVAGVRLVAEETPGGDVTTTEEDLGEIDDLASGDGEPGPAPPGPEISIARATVSGLDFVYLDETVQPHFALPIDDLSLEVQRFSTRTLTENRPFSFRLLVDAGEVQLPERSGADNLLFGVLGSVAGAATLQGDSFDTEQRPVWDLFEVDGRMSLGPTPTGRIQTTVFGLELPTFQGLASASGVDIGDGLVDHRSKVRLRPDGGVSVDTKTTTTYLSLSEPPDGPITKYLSLPAPLDTVLFLLRNEDGAQELPVRLDVGPGGVSTGSIAALAAETLGLLITDALSSAPLRVLGPLGSVAGALGLTPTALTAETVTLEFAPGATTVGAAAAAQGSGGLAALGEVLRKNTDQRVVVQGVIGLGDIEVARRIGNPPAELIQGLIEAKRRRKAALEEERARAAASARALLTVGESDRAAERMDEVRALDGERARIENALDELFERIRPGAERRAEARTRSAALALARERQERVRQRLIELAGPASSARIDVRRPRYVAPKKGGEGESEIPERGAVTITPK